MKNLRSKKLITLITVVALSVTLGFGAFNNLTSGVTPSVGEPQSLKELVEYPEGPIDTAIEYVTDSGDRAGWIEIMTSSPDYAAVSKALGDKGYNFDLTDNAEVSYVSSTSFGGQGPLLSSWSTETGANGERAFITVARIGGESMVVGGITNLLPPDQVPEVDPYIIVNAMPYLYIRWYWYAWLPIGRVVSWYYWWYDSHSHPNWYWGCYWWWRTYIADYWEGPGFGFWRPWWGWYWHWIYWRHWYWWSTYFPY